MSERSRSAESKVPAPYANATRAPWVKPTTAAIAVACLSLAGAVLGMRLWQANLNIPWRLGIDPATTDVSLMATAAKATAENGWYFNIPRLGAPCGAELYDFPFANPTMIAAFRTLSALGLGYGAVLNLCFLLTFPAVGLAALAALRSLDISWPVAAVTAVLFALAPYHFSRGAHHLALSAYYVVPLMVMAALWIWNGSLDWRASGRGRCAIALMVAVMAGAGNVYYAFFGCFLMVIAGLAGAIRRRTLYPITAAAVLSTIVLALLFLATVPTFRYARRHGKDLEANRRVSAEAELYGLRIAQMVLPMTDHRLAPFARLRAAYNETLPGLTESDWSALGTIACFGFVVLLLRLLWPRSSGADLLDRLAILNVAALLLGTAGAFGTVFAFLISPQIRCYNRICIYIAFLSLAAVAVLMDRLGRRMPSRALWYGCLGVLLVAGFLDQTSTRFVPDYSTLAARARSDSRFVGWIETSLPPGAAVFQLPWVAFPEGHMIERMYMYDLLGAYLHSRSLRWSFGAMRGRPNAQWQERVAAALSAAAANATFGVDDGRALRTRMTGPLRTLVLAGFQGIYIDRDGYADDADSLIAALAQTLNEAPLLSPNRRLAFFNLSEFAHEITAGISAAQLKSMRAAAMPRCIGNSPASSPAGDL
jgi:hypothetical protein